MKNMLENKENTTLRTQKNNTLGKNFPLTSYSDEGKEIIQDKIGQFLGRIFLDTYARNIDTEPKT